MIKMNKASSVQWYWSGFDGLSNKQLYQMLKLRQDVFVIEQQCIYPDIDDLDTRCLHLLGYLDNDDNHHQLVAYLRLIPAKIHLSGNIALGRIISLASQRGMGIGKSLMREAMGYVSEHFPQHNVQLSAQCYLQEFYQSFGFKCISEAYDDDGIMHIDMLFKYH